MSISTQFPSELPEELPKELLRKSQKLPNKFPKNCRKIAVMNCQMYLNITPNKITEANINRITLNIVYEIPAETHE